MLPGSRTAGEVFAIPQCSLAQGDVEGFLHEWRGFHEAFRDCFARREPREQFFGYMVGQFSALERQAIEPMALQVDGGSVRAMQRLISDVVWEEVQMRRTYQSLLHDDVGEADGVLIFDESGFPKQGPRVGGRGAAVLWHPGQGGEWSSGSVCGLCVRAWVCVRGQAVVPP